MRSHFTAPSALLLAAALGSAGATSDLLSISDKLPTGWFYQGCWSPQVTGEAFYSGRQMTQESCAGFCSSQGYSAAGVAHGEQCSCWNWAGLPAGALLQLPEADCDKACAGAADGQLCGAASAADAVVGLFVHLDGLARQNRARDEGDGDGNGTTVDANGCRRCPRCNPCPDPPYPTGPPPTDYPTSWNSRTSTTVASSSQVCIYSRFSRGWT